MYRFIQFDVKTGRLKGSMASCELDADGRPIAPEGSIVLDSDLRPEAATSVAYDAEADALEAAPPPRRLLTKADVIAALAPERWADLNKYHPSAAEQKYRDAGVYWAMSVFHASSRPFAIDDARVAQVFNALVAGAAMTDQEVETLRARLRG